MRLQGEEVEGTVEPGSHNPGRKARQVAPSPGLGTVQQTEGSAPLGGRRGREGSTGAGRGGRPRWQPTTLPQPSSVKREQHRPPGVLRKGVSRWVTRRVVGESGGLRGGSCRSRTEAALKHPPPFIFPQRNRDFLQIPGTRGPKPGSVQRSKFTPTAKSMRVSSLCLWGECAEWGREGGEESMAARHSGGGWRHAGFP